MTYWGEDRDEERRRQGEAPAPFAGLLGELIARRGWHQRLEGARVHGHWSEIAGPQLARHTEPVRLVGGVLVLRAASGGWAAQVRYLTAELAARANAVLGQDQVRRVTVTVGPLQGTGDAVLPVDTSCTPPEVP